MVEYFVKIGADMTIRTNNGDDCSYFAKSRIGNYKVAQYLKSLPRSTINTSTHKDNLFTNEAIKKTNKLQNIDLLNENKKLRDQNEKLWKILNKIKTKKPNEPN